MSVNNSAGETTLRSRFVVLVHDHPRLHWDLMLARDRVLRTWRLATAPEGAEPVEAVPLPDHRLFYLDYEGPVSGNRGTVSRWDQGYYQVLAEDPRGLRLLFGGRRLHGEADLSQNAAGRWVFRRTTCGADEAEGVPDPTAEG